MARLSWVHSLAYRYRMTLTVMEAAVLQRFHELYKEVGFPPPHEVNVVRRQNTGGGRYVDLACETPVAIEDGYVDLAGSYIEMEDIPNGMMSVVLIQDGRLKVLEFTVYG